MCSVILLNNLDGYNVKGFCIQLDEIGILISNFRRQQPPRQIPARKTGNLQREEVVRSSRSEECGGGGGKTLPLANNIRPSLL